MTKLWLVLSLVLTLTLTLTLACGGGGSGSGGVPPVPAVPAPSNLQAAYDPASQVITLTWTAPATAVDGYNLEASLNSSPFQMVNTSLIPSMYNGATLTLANSGIPEYAEITFRMDALLNGMASPYSNTATLRTGLAAPYSVSASADPDALAIHVYWVANSTAPQFLLMRAECDAAGNLTSGWTTMASGPQPTANGYLDSTVQDARYYLYKVANVDGGDISVATLQKSPVQAPPLAPTDLKATSAGSQVTLSWVNHSSGAQAISVIQSGGRGWFLLPPGAETCQVSGLAPGYYTFWVSATLDPKATTVVERRSAAATVAVQGDAVAPGTWTATALDLPDFWDAVLHPGGTWVLGQKSPIGILAAPGAGAWSSWQSGDGVFVARDSLALDANRLPHELFGRAVAGALPEYFTLAHAWFDGGQWKLEDLCPGGAVLLDVSNGYTYALDSAGTPQALLDTYSAADPNGGTIATLRYVHKDSGVWKAEPMAGLSSLPWTYGLGGMVRLALDRNDAPHVLMLTSGSLYFIDRNPDGTWAPTVLAAGLDLKDVGENLVDFRVLDANTAWVFFVADVPSAGWTQEVLHVQEKRGGVWQAPTALLGGQFEFDHQIYQVARSANGRMAVVARTVSSVVALVETPNGWLSTVVAPGYLAIMPSVVKAGFDAGNRLHVLAQDQAGRWMDFHE